MAHTFTAAQLLHACLLQSVLDRRPRRVCPFVALAHGARRDRSNDFLRLRHSSAFLTLCARGMKRQR